MGIAENIKELVGLGSGIHSTHDLFVHGVKDIYYGECQLVEALHDMSDEAVSPQLKQQFRAHADETAGQVKRLEEVFKHLKMEPEKDTCEAINGLIAEAKELMDDADPALVDASLIYAAEAVEHYEIARYTSLARMANELGYKQITELLLSNLKEETAASKDLAQMATDTTTKVKVKGADVEHHRRPAAHAHK